MTFRKRVLIIFSFILLAQIVLFFRGPADDDPLPWSTPIVTAESGPAQQYLPLLQVPTKNAPQENWFYVASDGHDSEDGSLAHPWASINHALEAVPDGSTIAVRPGTYVGEVQLNRAVSEGIVIRSEVPYRARLRNDGRVVSAFFGRNLTLEGFDISHQGPTDGRYVIQIQDAAGDGKGGVDITLRNNVLHDSYNNDILKVNNGASNITIEDNVFYNQGGPDTDSHIDVNSAQGIIIQDNIFFNDFAGSGREDRHNGGHFLLIKDSNGAADAFLGSQDIIVRRNLFLNWEGAPGNAFIGLGDNSAVDFFQAHDITIENNLMLGNSADKIHAALKVISSANVLFRNNTVVGDMPSNTFAMRLDANNAGLKNVNIQFLNNCWVDPTGTMGAEDAADSLDFSDTPPEATASFILRNNLYWNGERPIPQEGGELINFTDDPERQVADPLLRKRQDGIVLPRWNPVDGTFGSGAQTIAEARLLLAQRYGKPPANSAAVDAADPAYAPAEDLLGQPRSAGRGPDLGAIEVDSAP